MDKGWMSTNIRQVHMDFHMPEFPKDAIKNFNAEEFVSMLVHGKINLVSLFAKCHFGNSFYNTRVGHKHSGLAQDFLMETAKECRKQGIKTTAYYSLSTDTRAYMEHSNWRQVDAEGKAFPLDGPSGRVCINSPYKEELVLPQIEEIIKDYPIDGLFFDIPFSRGCFCNSCKTKFRGMYGKEFDLSVSEAERYAFHQNSTARFLKEVRTLIMRHNPALKIFANQAGHSDVPRTFSKECDYGVWESQPRTYYLSHSFAARTVRTAEPPTQIMSVRFHGGWGDLTLKPTAQMITEFAAMIGNGVPACAGDQVSVDGTLQGAVCDMFNRAFGFVEQREKFLEECENVGETALLAPVPREDYPAPGAVSIEMRGAHKALVESHVQFDILNSLDIHKLGDYKRIVLTEPNDYSVNVFEELTKWVKAGGTLIAAGTSLVHQGKMQMEDVFGIKYLEPLVYSVSHFKPRMEIRGEMDDIPLQCRGKVQKVLLDGASILADLIYPQTESIPERAFRNICPPPGNSLSGYPFVSVNNYGKGKAVYIAGSIFGIYWDTNHHWLRQLIDGIFKVVDPNPIYSIEAPATVEANMMKKGEKGYLLNLIHYQIGQRADSKGIPCIEKVYPLHGIKCMVKLRNVKSVILRPENCSLSFSQEGEYITFTIPELRYLAMVEILL